VVPESRNTEGRKLYPCYRQNKINLRAFKHLRTNNKLKLELSMEL
jgi:hypothetical protein